MPGIEEGFHDNACIMNAGQNYITLTRGGGWHRSGDGCDWSKPASIKIHVSNNKVYEPGGEAMVSYCSDRPPPLTTSNSSTVSRRSVEVEQRSSGDRTGCQLYIDTNCSDGFDLSSEPMGKVTPTAAACMAECAKNCACAIGVWGKTAQGTHKCHLKSKGPELEPHGAYKGNKVLTCKATCTPPKPVPPPPPRPGGTMAIKFVELAKLGVDPGSSIAEVPSTAEIIEMGMAVLTSSDIIIEWKSQLVLIFILLLTSDTPLANQYLSTKSQQILDSCCSEVFMQLVCTPICL